MRMLDLFCGRFGWSKAFAERGWHCLGIDLVQPAEIPGHCLFQSVNVLSIVWDASIRRFRNTDDGFIFPHFDFGCASSPCENFSLFGLRNFHPNPPYPELGVQLFNHTRSIFEQSGMPYVMENVRAAQEFVGRAVNHCGPFYLWGNAVPPILPQGITKGFNLGTGKEAKRLKAISKAALIEYRKKTDAWHASKSPQRIANTAKVATIPPELSACVAEYAERLLEMRATA